MQRTNEKKRKLEIELLVDSLFLLHLCLAVTQLLIHMTDQGRNYRIYQERVRLNDFLFTNSTTDLTHHP